MNRMRNHGAYGIWCQKVLPLVYDESLSYYELLCKVVKHLTDTIKDVDEHNESIAGLSTSFTELKNYVEHYFDELGVAAEIDRKLDAMAANGTLERLFKEWVGDSLDDVRGDVEKDVQVVRNQVAALEGKVNAMTQEGIGEGVYGEALVDETGFVFNSLSERLSSKHNGVTIVQRPMNQVGSSYRTGKIYKGSADITIKGDFPKTIRIYDKLEDENASEVIKKDLDSAYILRGYEGKYFECLNTTPPTGPVELVYGRTLTKNTPITGTPTFNLLPSGSSNWGARAIASACSGMSIPVSTRGFKEMVVDYDYSAVIVKSVNPTVTDPPAPQYAYQICGYNRITKDMLPDTDVCLIVIVPADIGLLSAERYDNVKSGGVRNPIQNCFDIKCDYNKVTNGVNFVIERNIEKLEKVGVKIKQNWHPRYTTQYTPASGDFHGILYGGAPYSGTVGVNITPAMYYTALLNPFSCAYGSISTEETGCDEYGITCSRYVSLLCGHPFGYTTLNFLNGDFEYKGEEIPGFILSGDVGTLDVNDILFEKRGTSGHSMLVRDVYTSDGVCYVKIKESANPYTQDNLICLTDDIVYDNHAPAISYLLNEFSAFSVDPSKCVELGRVIPFDATPAYTVPMPVMCNRGYGALYVVYNGTEGLKVIVSIKDDVEEIVVSNVTKQLSQTVVKANLTKVANYRDNFADGYTPYDLTSVVLALGTTGEFAVTAQGHVERFFVKDVTSVSVEWNNNGRGYTVVCSTTGDAVFGYLARYTFDDGSENYLYSHSGDFPLEIDVGGSIGEIVNGVHDFKVIIHDAITNCTYWCSGGAKGV